MDEVVFYFNYNSPYSMFAHHRIEQLLRPFEVSIVYRPWFTGVRLPDLESPKVRYVVEDVIRHARVYALALRPGPYVDLTLACCGFFFAADRGCGRAYNEGVHRARWLDGEDVSELRTLRRVATGCGLDPEALARAAGDPAYAERLAGCARKGAALGVFGVPFFLHRGRRFWGNDRLDWLLDSLRDTTPPARAG